MEDIARDSRLLNNNEELRKSLLSRNLYEIDKGYSIDTLNQGNKFLRKVDKVLDIAMPFKSINIDKSALGLLLSDKTPLTEIGLKTLSKQFIYNSVSKVSREQLPTINPINLLKKGSDNKFITPNINMSITVKKPETVGQHITGFLNKIVYYKSPTSEITQLNKPDYDRSIALGGDKHVVIENYKEKVIINDINLYKDLNKYTGKGQLQFLYNNLNKNLYKHTTNTEVESKLYGANYTERNYITDNIIWGVDGVDYEYNRESVEGSENIKGNISNENAEDLKVINLNNVDTNKFKIKNDLLDYTRKLINANKGKLIDITRKKYGVGYNGSSLYESNDSDYYNYNGTHGSKRGNRQHSILDPYGTFPKAIRYDGNIVYGGNKNSVIYDTVEPRIFPKLLDTGKFDTTNLMFSIENLAYNINDDGSFGGDRWGRVPLHEIGSNKGRVMWFPPYDISINETTTSTYDSTVMVGRNEPMYNYMYSERSAMLTFKLLVDYPQELKNYKGKSNEEISKFFAFGGDKSTQEPNIEDVEINIIDLEDKIRDIEGKPNHEHITEDEKFDPINTYFSNDQPKEHNINNIFNYMYYDQQYEIIEGMVSNSNGEYILGQESKGLNKDIYNDDYLVNISDDFNIKYKLTTSYQSQYENDTYTKLDNELKKLLINENNVELYKIKLNAYSSRLFLVDEKREEYNLKLSERRAGAVKRLIEERVKVITSDENNFNSVIDINKFITKFEIVNKGDTESSKEYEDPKKMNDLEAKKERRVEIEIVRDYDKSRPVIKKELTPDETVLLDYYKELLRECEDKLLSLNKPKQLFKEKGINDGNKNDLKVISDNIYKPIYHSQTPEDFHRRLTFLQQCMRQGEASVVEDSIDEQGISRAKNSVFGRQPICILRIGDFLYSKIIIETLNIDYDETTWDLNPEGFGLQPMIADITLNIKIIGGQSLKGPINALQNALSFNHYANSTYTDKGVYRYAKDEENKQYTEESSDKRESLLNQ